jgi:putative ABC transport system permease protein
MSAWFSDLHLTLRGLMRTPVVTVAAIILLALGIGAVTAIFTFADLLLLRPAGIADADRVVQIWDEYPAVGPKSAVLIATDNFTDYETGARGLLDRIAAIGRTTAYRTQATGFDEVQIEFVSADLFAIVGARALRGRTFRPEEDRPGSAPVVMLTYETWQAEYAADPDIVGKTVTLRYFQGAGVNPYPETIAEIVGVLEPGYRLPAMKAFLTLVRPSAPDLVASLGMFHWGRGNRGMQAWSSLARLAPGVTEEQAGAALAEVAAGIAEAYPQVSAGYTAKVTSLVSVQRDQFTSRLLTLWGAAGLVLVLGCANVGALLFGRTLVRRRELAVRAALGAGRGRLIAFLLSEALLLAACAAGLGIALAVAMRAMLTTLVPSALLGPGVPPLGWRAFVFSTIVALGTALLCGLLPAVRASRTDITHALGAGGPGSRGGQLRPLRLLVAVEAALTIVLVVAAGLFGRTFVNVLAVDVGVATPDLVAMQLRKPPAPLSRYATPAADAALFDRLRERIEALPDVEAVAFVSVAPLFGAGGGSDITLSDRPLPPAGARPAVSWLRASPGYFETARIGLLEGRTFVGADAETWLSVQPPPPGTPERDRFAVEVRNRSVPVIVNRSFAERYWPGESAIGKRFRWGIQDLEAGIWDDRYPPPPTLEIVGVVADVRHARLDVEHSLQYYTPQKRVENLIVRLRPGRRVPAEALREATESLEPGELTFVGAMALDDRYADVVAIPRFQMQLVTFFAVCSLLMAAVGLFGVMSYSVRRRTQEIGVRIALGASPGSVYRLVIGEGLALTVAGLGAGLVAALALGRTVDGLLFGVSASDPTVLAAGSAVLLVTGALACVWPARRAAALEPIAALRDE